MKMLSIEQELKSNSYPGRGIILGKSEDGTKAVDIVSVFDGVVVNVTEASSGSGAGNSLEVFDEVTGLYVRYMHMALKPNFNMNDNVKKGDVLATFDSSVITEAGLDDTTMVIVTNTADFEDVSSVATGSVAEGADFIAVK